MILHINTKDQKKVVVSLKKDTEVVSELFEENRFGSQVLLPLIIKLLKRMHKPGLVIQNQTGIVHWKNLEGIEVETGPGSFTGLRVGVAVANALGFSLGLPVNGKRMETNLIYQKFKNKDL
mgnify:FL=1